MEGDEMSVSGSIRKKMQKYGGDPYLYQIFNKEESPDPWDGYRSSKENESIFQEFRVGIKDFSSYEFPSLLGNIGEGKPCRYSELKNITDFKDDKLLQGTQLGRLFCGTITEGSEKRSVIVKTWDLLLPEILEYEYRPFQFCDEIELYETVIAHKYLAKLSGYCCERRLAVVYDENYSMVLSDVLQADNFGWDKRINVATQLAELLAWLNEKGITVGSVTGSCIMIDKEMNDIKVFDFGCISRHVNEDSKIRSDGRRHGRIPPEIFREGVYTMKSDVYIFGFLLMELINKRHIHFRLPPDDSIVDEVMHGRESLVRECFQVDDQTASAITELASRCLSLQPEKRPTMTEVFNDLQKLRRRGQLRREILREREEVRGEILRRLREEEEEVTREILRREKEEEEARREILRREEKF